MRSWFKYSVVPSLRRRVEKVKLWVAWHVPKWLAYWCTIRVGAHATTGKWSNQIVPELTVADALQRWH
jgi:hypothetical protein